eukprot:TRINITY_DN5205_c0_g1_i2.p1 TRINITY_DN5205_c0_g1~~TRINITY_DN5205_c0_g1_i2.p1  ORF type:complete len:294 (+),score=58.67 TRINITY_DN5205_c0_g1_i2:69-950(+)
MWSFHSHSGQFCKHAANTLEEMIQQAIDLGFTHYGLSEHMPRHRQCDLYPEELELGMTPQSLIQQFDDYVHEARRLQAKYSTDIKLFVGFETELIRDEWYQDVQQLRNAHSLDYVVGSVHHVKGIPIDFDEAKTQQAQDACGSLEGLALTYFDHVTTMINVLKPDVIGHLDLIRLLRPDIEPTTAVKTAIAGAVEAGLRHNCVFEINTAGLRKGLAGPYPHDDVMALLVEKGAKLCISDDAHKVEHVGTCYGKLRGYLRKHGVRQLWYMDREDGGIVWRSTSDWDSDDYWAKF